MTDFDFDEYAARVDALLGSAPLVIRPLAEVLDDVGLYLDRFMWITPEQRDALVLWIGHTHGIESFDVCAYLFVTSPDKRCGKSLLLDLVELLSANGMSTSNISTAPLFRMLNEHHPTLLFDEVDNMFGKKGKNIDPSKADQIALINTGFRRGKHAFRMGGANNRTLERFDPYGPKPLAGIGNCLPDTTADRCVEIRLRRKPPTVTRERFRIRVNESEAAHLGWDIKTAIAAVADELADAWPDLPEALNDRQRDIWEPMLAVADAAGEDWPKRARVAALTLRGVDTDSNELLADIRRVFTTERMLTREIVEKLIALDEAPWRDMNRGNGITQSWLAASAQTVRTVIEGHAH